MPWRRAFRSGRFTPGFSVRFVNMSKDARTWASSEFTSGYLRVPRRPIRSTSTKQFGNRKVRPSDRLGLVLFYHQTDVPGARLYLQVCRQLRRCDPHHHGFGQGNLLPLANRSYMAMAKMKACSPRSWRSATAFPTTSISSRWKSWRFTSAKGSIRSPLRAGDDPDSVFFRSTRRSSSRSRCGRRRFSDGSRICRSRPDQRLQSVWPHSL